MATNAELNKEVKKLKKAVESILSDLHKYSKVNMCDAKVYLEELIK